MSVDLPIRQVVRTVAEAGISKPAGAASSVFDVAPPPPMPLCLVENIKLLLALRNESDDAVVRRELAALVCRTLVRRQGITAMELTA